MPTSERTLDQIQTLASEQFVQFRETLLGGLNEFRSDNDQYATNRAIQRIATILGGFPSTRAKEPMTSQISEDFGTYPLWEAAVITIKSYVPWTDPTVTQEQRDQMSRILLTIAAQSLDWLRHDRAGNVQHDIR